MRKRCADVPTAVEFIWESMMGAQLERSSPHTPAEGETMWISSVIHFFGDWNGAIRLDCSWELARQATAQMYGIDIDNVPNEVACDAVAELANMIAGAVKPVLGIHSRHSLPTVVRGDSYENTVPNSRADAQFGFGSGSNYLSVTLLRRGSLIRQEASRKWGLLAN
jgi:CheY-specific phosphatase CheX